jgi:hypothetical protein
MENEENERRPNISEKPVFSTSIPRSNDKGRVPMARWIPIVLILFLVVPLTSCNNQESGTENSPPVVAFNPDTLKIPDRGGRRLRGQLLYMPIYSNVPVQEKQQYDLSAFLAIHNTDLKNRILVTKVDYFNTDGKRVRECISAPQQIGPLATEIFTISRRDQSGTGANFLVEWMSDQPVNEPLVESVMKDLSGNLGLSFLSTGRVIREIP